MYVHGAMSREVDRPLGEDQAVGGDYDDVGAEGLKLSTSLFGGESFRLKDGKAERLGQEFDGGLAGLLAGVKKR